MIETEKYLIHELAEKAGVTVRTIRYYTLEGLLPQPDQTGKFAYYSEEHIARLRLILRLKDSYLPLREIRQTLAALSDEEVRARLEQPLPSPAPQDLVSQIYKATPGPKSGALDYINHIMEQQAGPRPDPQPTPPPAPRPSPPTPLQGEPWRRIELLPGLELHIREHSPYSLSEDLLRKIIAFIRQSIQ